MGQTKRDQKQKKTDRNNAKQRNEDERVILRLTDAYECTYNEWYITETREFGGGCYDSRYYPFTVFNVKINV